MKAPIRERITPLPIGAAEPGKPGSYEKGPNVEAEDWTGMVARHTRRLSSEGSTPQCLLTKRGETLTVDRDQYSLVAEFDCGLSDK